MAQEMRLGAWLCSKGQDVVELQFTGAKRARINMFVKANAKKRTAELSEFDDGVAQGHWVDVLAEAS